MASNKARFLRFAVFSDSILQHLLWSTAAAGHKDFTDASFTVIVLSHVHRNTKK